MHLSIKFVKIHAIRIQEHKHSYKLFKITKCIDDLLKEYMDRFKVALLLVSNLNQYMTLEAVIKRLSSSHSVHESVIASWIEKH